VAEAVLTRRLDYIVLLSYSNLQCFKVMILIDVNILMKHVFALPNEIKAFDSHVGDFGML
jgi:hypothetical protein